MGGAYAGSPLRTLWFAYTVQQFGIREVCILLAARGKNLGGATPDPRNPVTVRLYHS